MATVRRNLRTGYPIWAGRRAPSVAHQCLARDIKTDVLVIGAGITGAMIADALSATGLDVAVADRRGLAKGSTVASTALVQYEIDTPLIRLTRKIGKANAVRAWRRSHLAVAGLAARFDELKLTDVTRRNSLYLAGNVLGRNALEHEHQARKAAGLPSRFLDRKSLRDEFGIARAAALVSHGSVVIDPRKATLALLQAAAIQGAALFAPADIVNVAPQRGGVVATVDNGYRIRCRHLVFATGYELPHGVPRRHHKINSTWAIATVPQRRGALWPGECCVWEAADPYLYVRTTPDGRVICGGGDQEFSDDERRDALIGRKTAMLRRKLHRLFPKLDTSVEFAWAGAFGETTTGLPIIGPVPGMPRCWTALGYGGNGTTYAAIAADVITGAIAGRPDVDADLYRFPAHDAAS
ncbi:MAG TPA: FAD-binding oxidoreductase [Xanthobacteraceae bacterium]|nr:FAD-binding oxidoreductase [Xanthobacteraceae bacterium]